MANLKTNKKMIKAISKDSIKLQGSLNEQTFQLLEATGLNWSVEKKALVTECGLKTDSFGLFRRDNNAHLGTTGSQYTPYQNFELAETIIQASAGLGDSFRGGHLSGGEKVFFQLALKDEIIGTDTLKRHITALNSHDSTTSVGFGSSNTVVICQNTFFMAYRDLTKVMHSKSVKANVEIVAKRLMESMKMDEMLMQNYKRMEETKISKSMLSSVINIMFRDVLEEAKKGTEISSRKENQLAEFNTVLGKELASHGESVWGLFNAVTFYENHVRVKEADKKDQSIMIGSGYRIMNNSFNALLDFVNANTAEFVTVNR